MCRIGDVFTADELRTLSKTQRNILEKYGKLIVLTNPAIRNIIKKDPKVRKKLKGFLGPRTKALDAIISIPCPPPPPRERPLRLPQRIRSTRFVTAVSSCASSCAPY